MSDDSIRFAGVLGRNGDLVAGGYNKNVASLVSSEEEKCLFIMPP
jgi:hypothetical protein